MAIKGIRIGICRKCQCYTCKINAHVKPDEEIRYDGGRILKIPMQMKCIGCSMCYINQKNILRDECRDYIREDKNGRKHS